MSTLDIQVVNPKNYGWLQLKLPPDVVNHIWDCVDNTHSYKDKVMSNFFNSEQVQDSDLSLALEAVKFTERNSNSAEKDNQTDVQLTDSDEDLDDLVLSSLLDNGIDEESGSDGGECIDGNDGVSSDESDDDGFLRSTYTNTNNNETATVI